MLERLGIGDLAGRHIRALSGGQQQRVFIARALLGQADLLLLDEPTSGVDVRTRHEVLHVLGELHHDGLAILLTTHDLNGVATHLPQLVCLNQTIIASGSPLDVLRSDVLEATYGAPLDVLQHAGLPFVVDRPPRPPTRHHRPRGRPRCGGRLMHVLLEPFQYGFLRHALVVCTFAGALCGLLGVFVTLRGMSYIGHGLSHAIFGGAAVSAAIGLNFFVGAGIWGLGSGLAISRVTRRRIIGSDAAIGVITTASFAFGIALLGFYSRVKQSIEATVFGSVLGVSQADMWVVIGVAVVTAIVVVARYRPLLFTTFDAEVAQASGVNTDRVDALMMLLLCASILASMKVLGVTLIAAALVVPSVIARMLTDSFTKMLWLSSLIGGLAGLVGMYLSYHLDVSSGAAIVLLDFLVFAVVFAPHRHQGPPAHGSPLGADRPCRGSASRRRPGRGHRLTDTSPRGGPSYGPGRGASTARRP